MGVAGMVLGIIAIVFIFIPFVGIIVAFPCMVVGLPLSIVGLVQGRNNGTGIGMAVAGMVCNLIAIVIFVLALIVFGSFILALFG
jgi:hypothetical protein